MTDKDFKDLTRRTAYNKILRNKVFNLAQNLKYYGYQKSLASMVYDFFERKTSGSDIKNISNKELSEELHKPIIRKVNKRKVHSSFTDNIWGADLANMQLISKFNKGIRILLCVIDILVNTHGFLWKVKTKSQLITFFKKN